MNFRTLQQEQAYLSNRQRSRFSAVFGVNAPIQGRDAETGLFRLTSQGRDFAVRDFSWQANGINGGPKLGVVTNGGPGFLVG